ncbi:MAG: flagellin N-terminal helical domain-containing protein [Gemmatimonadaceae bacterium]
MRINTNTSALSAFNNLSRVEKDVAGSMAKLSSGFRINKASDDAAGLAIANKFRSDIKATNQALKNAEQAKSVLQLAEGGANQIQKLLERAKELAVQAASASVDSNGRARINTEFTQIKEEITRITDTTKFQGQKLLAANFGTAVTGGTALGTGKGIYSAESQGAAADTYTLTGAAGAGTAGTLTLTNGASVSQVVTGVVDGKGTYTFDQLGITIKTDTGFKASTATTASSADSTNIIVGGTGAAFLVGASASTNGELASDKITLSSMDLRLSNLGLGSSQVDTTANAESAVIAIETALSTVATTMATVGAKSNRLDSAIDGLKVTYENFSAAESVIRDVDMAEEMTKLSKNQILSQAGTAMLAQANQLGQGVLQLLRG